MTCCLFHLSKPLLLMVLSKCINRFAPLTASEPRALLPLLNVPLLDYTLEFLTTAGVQEIILFCCCFSEKIKTHVANSKWANLIKPIVSSKCLSVGDALREISSLNCVRNTFILVSGDIVSNCKLGALELHK